MKKKKQNNIGDFDLCEDTYNLEAEIEPGYRLFFPWLHREYWQEQHTKQGRTKKNLHLNSEKKQVDAVIKR